MGTKGKKQKRNSRSDVSQKKAFKEFLVKTIGIDENFITTTGNEADVVVLNKDGVPEKFFELKTSKKTEENLSKKGYFGAASLTEWYVAYKRPEDYYFVFIIGKARKNYKYLIVKAKDLYSYATVPPFAIYINIKFGEYLNAFKKLNEVKKIDSIDDEVTHILPKQRSEDRSSLGVNDEIIDELHKKYEELKSLYLAQ